MQVKDAIFDIVGVLCVGLASGRLRLRNLASVAILFGELLNPSTANLELLGDQAGIRVVITNTLIDPGNIGLVKLHFTCSIVGEILPTKSLTYTTPRTDLRTLINRPDTIG